VYETCVDGRCTCEPSCDGTRCGDDGCGGACECPETLRCNSDEQCVEETLCLETCESVGMECGEICGVSCGECGTNETCRNGKCLCEPDCDGTHCGDDGCGDVSECPGGYSCDSEGICIQPEVCEETCDSLGYACGEVCDQRCGSCRSDERCTLGLCICKPVCDGTHCGENNCGGACTCGDENQCDATYACVSEEACTDTCETAGAICGAICGHPCGACSEPFQACIEGACAPIESCEGCPLVMSVEEVVLAGEILEKIVIAIDYQPRDGDPRARMMDLFIASSPAMVLRDAEEGPALTNVDKSFTTDPDTGNPWMTVARGEYRFVVLSSFSSDNDEAVGYFEPGRLMTLEFTTEAELLNTAVEFKIIKKSQVFTPSGADLLLQISPYDTPVSVVVR
jgi:hypothetical protein